jgi:hypothetical protein
MAWCEGTFLFEHGSADGFLDQVAGCEVGPCQMPLFNFGEPGAIEIR